jgi:hypothetical protein
MKQLITKQQWTALNPRQQMLLVKVLGKSSQSAIYLDHDNTPMITIGTLIELIDHYSLDWYIDRIDRKHNIEVDVEIGGDCLRHKGKNCCKRELFDSLWAEVVHYLGVKTV